LGNIKKHAAAATRATELGLLGFPLRRASRGREGRNEHCTRLHVPELLGKFSSCFHISAQFSLLPMSGSCAFETRQPQIVFHKRENQTRLEEQQRERFGLIFIPRLCFPQKSIRNITPLTHALAATPEWHRHPARAP